MNSLILVGIAPSQGIFSCIVCGSSNSVVITKVAVVSMMCTLLRHNLYLNVYLVDVTCVNDDGWVSNTYCDLLFIYT